jgi:putative Holliday junction resolvase
MTEETLLAFDYGVKKIGVAIGNTLTRQARPLQIVATSTREQRFRAIAELVGEWMPDRVIVGLPLAPDGGEQYATSRCRRFANQLRGRFGLDVELVDERNSSVEAQQVLGTHDADDAVAAAIILQRYFDALDAGTASGRPGDSGTAASP